MTPQLSLNLANLRLWLADAQYQALRIGTGDEFLNKYAPAYTKRIGWLTGFEGSAGDLLITAHAATLVTDRRYTDIALEILDPSLFTVTDHAATSPEEWLIQNLAPGDRVACHGWVYSMRQMNRMEAALAKAGIALTLLDENPVDALWPTQPPRDIVPAWPHDITYAGKTSTDKRSDIAQTLGQHERLLLTSGEFF